MRSRGGFTLIETLVAVFVLVMAILLFAAALSTFRLTRASADNFTALSAGETEIESLRAGGYGALPGNGSFSNSLLSSLSNATGTLTFTTFNAKTKEVVVKVSWTEPYAGAQSLTLATLITSTGGL